MKTLQKVVSEILCKPVSVNEAKEFANSQFGQVYAWVKADVVANILKDKL